MPGTRKESTSKDVAFYDKTKMAEILCEKFGIAVYPICVASCTYSLILASYHISKSHAQLYKYLTIYITDSYKNITGNVLNIV